MAKVIEDTNVRRIELDQPIQADHINDLVSAITSFLVDIIGVTDYSLYAGNDVRDHVVSRIRDLTVTPTDQNWQPVANKGSGISKIPEPTYTKQDLPDHFVFDVTEEDIASGKKGNAVSCPVALALKRRFPGPLSVIVGISCFTVRNKTYNLPLGLSKAIIKFDKTGYMETGRYYIYDKKGF